MALRDLRRSRRATLVALYLFLLLLSHVWRRLDDTQPMGTSVSDDSLLSFDTASGDSIVVAFHDDGDPGDERPVVVALHGSPGSSGDFVEILRQRSDRARWIVVDLPGFGASTRRLADYSFRTHAGHVRTVLDARGVDRAHLLAFSMGGGPALRLAALAPERVESLILLGSIGVQELELLGDYHLNHALHGAQLIGFWLIDLAFPHFGMFDGFLLDLPYARNFFDSDQRPLRAILRGFEKPLLILHGRVDPLVPVAAAEEHHRIVPQSELRLFDGGHFLPWERAAELARLCEDWVGRVQSGSAGSLAAAAPARVAAARVAFAELPQPRAEGIAWLLLVALLVAGTFVAEDLSCLSAGILIAQGRLGWFDGLFACAGGIFFGDLLLYAAGRWLGVGLAERAPLRWIISRRSLRHAEHWFRRRGLAVIFITRFIPGTRLPAYVAAGVLRTPFLSFASYFLLAVLLWTPIIVGLSAILGAGALARLRQLQHAGLLLLLLFGSLLLLLRLLLPLSSWKGRRLWWGRLQRWRRWEFWPSWLLYLFLLPHLLRLSWHHGGFHRATAVNPGIESGGLLGESKSAILRALGSNRPEIASFVSLPAGESTQRRMERVMAGGLRPPLVVKPDVGERGRGVEICRDDECLRARIARDSSTLIVQEFVEGPEFGVFYLRNPENGEGRIFSIARKLLPELRADGERSIEELLLADDRAACMAEFHLDGYGERLDEIPAAGARIRLAEIGTHCQGSLFLDGRDLESPALLAALDRIVAGWPGFQFGRFDLKAASEEDLRAGRNLKILELNGLSSEAAHVYDPKNGLRYAISTLGEQWTLAFAIAEQQIRRGARPTPAGRLLVRGARHLFGPSS